LRAYYNDNDLFVACWLQNLIAHNLIVPGVIDTRSITEVTADDVRPYKQAHFFAGIGGWSYALRLAGWPDDRPVWTGSCPCQPLSSAGQRQGHADGRHLWPAFYRLIAECRPPTIFGEQVASDLGREWLAGIRADLETLGYAVGAADLCAASVGAPHIRQRLYWVATFAEGMGDATGAGWQGQRGEQGTGGLRQGGQSRPPVQDGIAQWNGSTITIQRADGWARIAAEPALFPVAARLPGDVGRLRGAGNAIVPQVAATFITAFMDCAP